MNDHTLPSDDERYGTFALIRRLLTEQGIVHWRKYAFAFTLMAISAGCTAFSAYLIGDVINEGYVQQEPDRHLHPRRRHRRPVRHQGSRDLRPQRVAVADRQPHRRRQSAQRLRQAAQRRHRLFLRPALDRIHRAPERGRRGGDAGHQPADHLARARPAVADRAGHRHGRERPADVVLQLRGGAAGVLQCCAS